MFVTQGANMFEHLLLPTDGSPLSEAAIRMGVAFAKGIGAKVTGLHVIPRYHIVTYDEEMLADTKSQFAKDAESHAERYLALIEQAAGEASVPCETTSVISDRPYDAILKIADDRHCDLIVMASHGRQGIQGILIGSETQKVLTHSKLPVLVYR
jgi:nucleotide-binding universal stress UspA family protein